MRNKVLIASFLSALPIYCQAGATDWILQRSTLTYHVSHPLHHVDGISHAAKGKGVCHAGECNFLIAVPVNSFKSGDTNRDLHMLQITRGAQFPMIIVRALFPNSSSASATIHADLTVQFAGKTAQFEQIPFHEVTKGSGIRRVSGTIPATLSDFKIPAPELLMMFIKNEIPVDVETTWRKQ